MKRNDNVKRRKINVCNRVPVCRCLLENPSLRLSSTDIWIPRPTLRRAMVGPVPLHRALHCSACTLAALLP
jgi:hypothetical protein